MSEIIPLPDAHNSLWEALGEPEYRHGFSFGFVRDYIAAQIAALRMHRNWNQGALAERTGVSQPQISKWENGGESIRLDSLQRLAEAFDVALIVKFVPFSELVVREIGQRADMAVASFPDDAIPGSDSFAHEQDRPQSQGVSILERATRTHGQEQLGQYSYLQEYTRRHGPRVADQPPRLFNESPNMLGMGSRKWN